MAVMVTFTLKADAATYQGMHGQMLPLAKGAGMIFHSGREVDGGIGITDFWPSADAWQAFFDGPLSEGAKAMGLPVPGDVKVTPVLNADG
jgi:hypothetical protein